jgi:hypothetical protein
MPDAAWAMYDAIVYIDTPASTVHARLAEQAASVPRNYWARALTTNKLEDWCQYEKRKLESACTRRGRTFVSIPGERSVRDLAGTVVDFAAQIRRTCY